MWYGWAFIGHDWQRVCEAPTMDGAAEMLSQMYPTLPTVRQCISQGSVPHWRPR